MNVLEGGGGLQRWWSTITGWRWKEEKGDYFRKSLILVLLITSVPSIFIAISNYVIGIGQIEKELFRTHQIKFEQFSDTMNKQFDQIALVMSRWSTNSLYGDHLDDLVFIDNIDRMQEIMQSLLVVGGSNVLIDEAQLFLTRQRAVLASDGIRYLNTEQLKPYMSVLNHREGLFFAYGLPITSVSQKGTAPVSVIFKLPWHSELPFGAFVLNLNKTEMEQMIRHIHTDEKGTAAFLMRKTGEWVVPPRAEEAALSLQLKEVVLNRQGSMEAFPYKWNGESYMVSYGEVTKAEWLYVTATPMSELTKPVFDTSRLILASSAIGVLAALILAWFASKRLYRPIGRLVQLFQTDPLLQDDSVKHEIEFIEQQWNSLTRESQTLQERLKLSIPSLREGFLLQLVQGHLYALDEISLRERMSKLGWEVKDKVFSMLLIQLSGLNEQLARFKEDDQQLISFAAANIAEEQASVRIPDAHVINFQDLSIGLLCMLPQERSREESRRELYGLAQELIPTLGKMLGLQVTVMICRLTDQAGDIPELLEQARQAARYRDLQVSEQIIDMEDFAPSPQPVAHYPFTQEKELIHVLRLGLAEEAYTKFNEFMREVQLHADREIMVQQALFQLVGSMRHMLIELGFTRHALFTEGHLVEELIAIHEPAVMERWFSQRMMMPYLDEYRHTQNLQSRHLIERAMELLQAHYMEDLSLEECADRLSTSPYTLSRSFKQVAGLNYVDYIMNVRIDKAKELLMSTQLKISEIAEQVGYQHSYFNKIFKGAVGSTPTQYREQFRNRK
jgi:AraC-like DNA-binding protein